MDVDVDQRRLVAGRYRLLSPLGTGGMGTVWRARDEVLGREVAVKEVVFPHGLSDEDREVLRERTRREARAAARLDHPSAVTVYDVVEEEGAPYLVMELVEARTLSQVVRSDGPLSPQRTAEVGLALLGALETAHRQGIVHRDVKPGNVLLCPHQAGGRVVLTDFGIASTAGDSSITSTGLLLGSPSYIAPERARGQAPAPASDLWSLGATLFTAVEGRPPFDGGEPLATVTAVVTGERAPFVSAGPLERVLEGLLERDPAARLTAAAARELLVPLTRTAPVTSVAPPAPVEAERRTERTTALPMSEVQQAARPERSVRSSRSASRGDRRSKAPVVLLALLLLLGAVGGAFALLEGSPGDAPGATAGEGTDGGEDQEEGDGPAALPEGWTRYTSEADGWSIGIPPGYVQSTRNGQLQFRDESARRTLRIRTEPARGEPADIAAAYSRALAGQLSDYTEVRPAAAVPGQDAADVEFTYVSQTELRVVDRTVVQGNVAHHLWWQVNAGDWDDALPLFDQIADTFSAGG